MSGFFLIIIFILEQSFCESLKRENVVVKNKSTILWLIQFCETDDFMYLWENVRMTDTFCVHLNSIYLLLWHKTNSRWRQYSLGECRLVWMSCCIFFCLSFKDAFLSLNVLLIILNCTKTMIHWWSKQTKTKTAPKHCCN